MSKPKILVCVLCGIERANWINPDLMMNVLEMQRDSRFEVNWFPIRDVRPWEAARNMSIHGARTIHADWLISFDNDNFVKGNPLDIIAEAGPDKHVVGLTCGVGGQVDAGYHLFPNTDSYCGTTDGVFREVKHVGGPVLMISRAVWERIPQGPWFQFLYKPGNELHLTQPGEFISEDVWFCQLARRHGFKVWTHTKILAGHYRTTDITGMTCTLSQLTEQAKAGR